MLPISKPYTKSGLLRNRVFACGAYSIPASALNHALLQDTHLLRGLGPVYALVHSIDSNNALCLLQGLGPATEIH